MELSRDVCPLCGADSDERDDGYGCYACLDANEYPDEPTTEDDDDDGED